MPALPAPTAEAAAASAALAAAIRAEIEARGPIDFSRYMRHALYAPGLGYYAGGAAKFGAAGDFVTAPELGDVYARCVADASAPVLRETGGDFVELGAGSGAFAADALLALAACDAAPARYRILETSADLRERQAARIAASAPAHLGRVEWLDAPPEAPWDGVLFANEVVDALPAERFVRNDDGVFVEAVAWRDAGFRSVLRAATDDERATIEALAAETGPWPRPYRSEWLPSLAPWVATVTATLRRGAALFVDYGYPRRERYLPERRDGTLVCHYRHRAHDDPFVHLGLQDITTFVDFTALAEAGVAAGLELAAYLPQSAFLFASGLPERFADSASLSELQRYKLSAEVKRLTLPGEMGEKFKVMAFVREIDATTLACAALDRSGHL